VSHSSLGHPGSLVQTLNRLLREIHLSQLELEDLNDLTPSFLLVILESLLHERLPISKAIRESTDSSSKVEAMKIFLGVLADDLLVQTGFGETVINEVAEIDPRKLARGDHEECFIIGEVLCRLAMARGLLQVIHGEVQPIASRQFMDETNGYSDGERDETPSPAPRAPSPFSVSEISPPSRQETQNPPPRSSRFRPQSPSSPSKYKIAAQVPPTAATLTSVRRKYKRYVAEQSNLQDMNASSSNPRRRSHPAHVSVDDSMDDGGEAEDNSVQEYHATTFPIESSTASISSLLSSPTHSLCHCDRTLPSETDNSYCICGGSFYVHPRQHSNMDDEADSSHNIHQSQSEATLLDEDNPFYQFSHSRMPLDLLTARSSNRDVLSSLHQTRIEDKTISAHPTLIRTSGRIGRVDPEQDFGEFLRSHAPTNRSDLHSRSTRQQGSQIQTELLGPTRHSSPSEYRLALLAERARLYAEIARARAQAASDA
jgi:hypothetical protein